MYTREKITIASDKSRQTDILLSIATFRELIIVVCRKKKRVTSARFPLVFLSLSSEKEDDVTNLVYSHEKYIINQ